jgi:hypothetical protein
MLMEQPLRLWAEDQFFLLTWDTGRVDHLGKSILRYELRDLSRAPREHSIGIGAFHHWGLVFSGEDFACSPCHAIDSPEAMAAILGFLSLKPGDTDPEYFDDYTPKQRAWMEARAEDLSLARMSTLPED